MTTTEEQNEQESVHQARHELLEAINRFTDGPMTALAFVWLGLLIVDFTSGLSPFLEGVSNLIWGLFIADFLVELTIAPRKLAYLRSNWLTAVSLLLPALRVLRIARTVRVLRAARAVRSLGLVRLLISLNRGMRAVGRTLRRRGISYVVVLTLIVTFVGAAGMGRFENPDALREAGYTPEPGEGLDGYGEAVWWTAMIMTTMGSEYWPRTGEGRVLGWLLAVYAFAVFGYITATIASHFVGQDKQAGGAEETAGVPPAEVAALRAEIAALREQLRDMAGAAPLRGHRAPGTSTVERKPEQ